MTTTTQHTITYLSLLEKYNGDIKSAHPKEMQAAARTLDGKNALTALAEATREYLNEIEQRKTRAHPAICYNRDGHCDDDHCRCWK